MIFKSSSVFSGWKQSPATEILTAIVAVKKVIAINYGDGMELQAVPLKMVDPNKNRFCIKMIDWVTFTFNSLRNQLHMEESLYWIRCLQIISIVLYSDSLTHKKRRKKKL